MKEKGIVRNQRVSVKKVERSRELRKTMTEAEKVFWNMVRSRKLYGLKFRRQQVIDGFIIDFYCDSIGLCIEFDGDIHDKDNQVIYDKNRDETLSLRGLKVLRFRNEDVFNNKENIRDRIKTMLE